MRRILSIPVIAILHNPWNCADHIRDIKPDNVAVDGGESEHPIIKLTDLECVVHLPEGDVVDVAFGNAMWRIPEAHCKGRVNRPHDMFSFGATVCIRTRFHTKETLIRWASQCMWTMCGRILFKIDKEWLHDNHDLTALYLCHRQLGFFGDEDSIEGLQKHMDDGPSCENLKTVIDTPFKPALRWGDCDPVFQDLVCRLMNIDPAKWLTAQEALAHP